MKKKKKTLMGPQLSMGRKQAKKAIQLKTRAILREKEIISEKVEPRTQKAEPRVKENKGLENSLRGAKLGSHKENSMPLE